MKSKNVCKELNFADCELAILRIAVDKADTKMARRTVNSDDISKIIKIAKKICRNVI